MYKTFLSRYSDTDVWNSLSSGVQTKYVYVGRGVVKVTKDTKLETLIDKIMTTSSVAVSGSTNNIATGQVMYSADPPLVVDLVPG